MYVRAAAVSHLPGCVVLDLVGSLKYTLPLDDINTEADEGILEVSLHGVGEVLGVVSDALAVECDLALELDTESAKVRVVLHITDAA